MQNFFTLFSLPTHFVIDLSALEKSYFEAQRRFHPDRLVGKSVAERQQAILQSMLINEAYETLKSPLPRARHLLLLQGITVGSEQDSIKPSHELLMEIMELREALEESASSSELEKLEAANIIEKQNILKALSRAFAASDWQVVAAQTIRLGYLSKLEDEIRIKKKGVSA